MEKKRKLIPIWYIILMGVLYMLPFFAMALMIVVSNIKYGLLDVMAMFIGTMVAGTMIFFPFFCVYYGALAVIHAIIDEVIVFRAPPKWLRAILFVATFVFSAFLAASGILTIKIYYIDYEDTLLWALVLLMLLSAALSVAILEIRIAVGIVFEKLIHRKMRRRAVGDVQPPVIDERRVGVNINMCDSLPTKKEEQVTYPTIQ